MDPEEEETGDEMNGENRKTFVRRRWREAIDTVLSDIRKNRPTQQTQIHQVVTVLIDFLNAVREGDIESVDDLLTRFPDVDFNSTADALGNSPLTLAVKNDNSEIVSSLLDRVKYQHWRESLLVSISMDRDEISTLMIDSEEYENYRKLAQATGEPSTVRSKFPAAMTPLILAADHNQYGIVKLLLDKGERIPVPHHAYCVCNKCKDTQLVNDELEIAKTRLFTYRGLASNSYISMNSKDPILKAFKLRQALLKNAEIEKYFKAEYESIAEQLSEYTVKLLQQVRTGAELDTILRESTQHGDTDRLARLKLAIRYDEKLFVTHPSCQKKLQFLWADGWGDIERKSLFLRLLWCLGFGIIYPILAITYWISPWTKIGRFLETPVVKFIAEALYFMLFTALLIVYTFTEHPSEGYRLAEHDGMGGHFSLYNATAEEPAIGNIYVRVHHFRTITIVISIHVLGYLWQMVKLIYRNRLYYFTDNGYNLMDLCTYSLMTASFAMRYYTIFRVREAVAYFEDGENWDKLLASNGTDGDGHLKLLDADRASWDTWDGYYVAEALYSLAVIPALTRATYILTMSENMGPLLISLKHMFMNFVIFMAVFVVVLIGFLVSFNNLYWYYDEDTRKEAETPLRESTEAEYFYGSLLPLIRTLMFTLFGMTDATSVETSSDYENDITVSTGYILFGAYNWITVIIFLNMLIGMMAKAYDSISEAKDLEWKFDRTKLYLDYMKQGNTLCVPFNLVPTWWSAFRTCCEEGCCKSEEKSKQKSATPALTTGGGTYSNAAYQDDEPDKASLNGYISNTPATAGGMAKKMKSFNPVRSKKVKTMNSEYKIVIDLVRERFITACTTPGDDDGLGGDDGGQVLDQLLDQLKYELTRFRHDMARAVQRNEHDKKIIFKNFADLDERVKGNRDRLEEIMTSCQDTQTTLYEIKPSRARHWWYPGRPSLPNIPLDH